MINYYTQEQFEEDTRLITKLLYINAGLDGSLIKKADFGDDLINYLKDIAGYITQNVKQTYEDQGIAGLLNYIITGLLPVKLKFIAIIINSTLGIDLGDLLKAVFSTVQKTIDTKGEFTEADANHILNVAKTASLEVLKDFEKRGELHKFARRPFESQSSGGTWADMISKFLMPMPRHKKQSFGAGLVRWLLKLIFAGIIGATALEGSKALVQKTTGYDSESKDNKKEVSWSGYLPGSKSHSFKPSGWGTKKFPNTKDDIWLVPLQGTPENTLYQWIVKVYPELKDKSNEVIHLNSFNRMASILGDMQDPQFPNETQIPPDSGLHSIKDVVDRAISDI
jgi:hypothetical protein